MKKLLVFFVLILGASMASSQVGRRPFISINVGTNAHKDLTYSLETGFWGILKQTSFAATYDLSRNFGKGGNDKYYSYLGAKAYFTFYEKTDVVYMFYFAPKYQLGPNGDYILEFGVNPNITISKDLLLGLTLSNQTTSANQWNLGLSGGLVYMF